MFKDKEMHTQTVSHGRRSVKLKTWAQSPLYNNACFDHNDIVTI